jgi:arylsulfatase A-like enzyme
MLFRHIACGLLLVGAWTTWAWAAPIGGRARPNILVIVADDLGWNDVGYHNPSMRTPNIDRLARDGVELDCHYVQPQCTPTRVALLTGRYPSRFGPAAMKANNEPAVPPGTPMIATMLRSLGYSTGMAGKWHLGSTPEGGPQRFGFDSSYGGLAGALGMYDHRYQLHTPYAQTWHRDGDFIEGHENGTHATDLTLREVVRWIENHAAAPWFFYMAFHAPHAPIVENDETWHQINEHIEADDRRAYAAAVSHMDAAIGEVIAALKASGQRERTLILFTSDNGAQVDHPGGIYPPPDPPLSNFSSNAPLRGKKSELYEGGCRVPAALEWPGRLPPGKFSGPMHVVDWMPTFADLLGYEPAEEMHWDGESIWPRLEGRQKQPDERSFYLVWHPQRRWEALRRGDWKIVRRKGERWELFNLRIDPNEQQDRAEANPEKVEELIGYFDAERAKDPS